MSTVSESIGEETRTDARSGELSYPAQLLALVREREHFLITSHARPDGDAIGSALGLMHLLDGLGKRVEVAFSDPIPAIYQTLPGASRIWSPVQARTDPHERATLPPNPPEVAILLECDSIERTGFAAIPATFTINIDHHRSGRAFADWNWIEPGACAVGAQLYEFAVACGLPITPAVAVCLYTAVLTDTGSFTFPCTTAATFALAAHLIDCGADAHEIAQNVYFTNPEGKVRCLGAALGRMVVEGPLAWTVITQEDMEQSGALVADCEGVVNHLIGIAGVQAAAVLRETSVAESGGAFRVSLRSKGLVDVARVAESFGGGGHLHASGCTLQVPLERAIPAVRAALLAALE